MKIIKNLTLLTILLLFSVSCSPSNHEVNNPEKSTSIELVELSKQDSTLYKVVVLENDLYILNATTNLVEYKIYDDSFLTTSIVILLVVIFYLIIIRIIFE